MSRQELIDQHIHNYGGTAPKLEYELEAKELDAEHDSKDAQMVSAVRYSSAETDLWSLV